ncbi:hypothetical protein [Nitrospirillum sp. BR 11828]|uniref:hypothetical protein n=1 Tax=Nitrospirillum sp. BR 11828 TaxID=3104325 RepID=UPI002ACAC483|nr:hypothetical protein [Nitrospirillum sp. BR 11828]MDZ5650025.1 hypothetical protein [Nitrospirillum sp. BR 11828]
MRVLSIVTLSFISFYSSSAIPQEYFSDVRSIPSYSFGDWLRACSNESCFNDLNGAVVAIYDIEFNAPALSIGGSKGICIKKDQKVGDISRKIFEFSKENGKYNAMSFGSSIKMMMMEIYGCAVTIVK